MGAREDLPGFKSEGFLLILFGSVETAENLRSLSQPTPPSSLWTSLPVWLRDERSVARAGKGAEGGRRRIRRLERSCESVNASVGWSSFTCTASPSNV